MDLIAGRRADDKVYFVLYLAQQIVPVRLPFDEFYGVTDELHQTVVIRKLPLAVGHVSGEGGIHFNMPGYIHRPFYVAVVVPVPYVPLKEALPHGGFQIIRKQEQQKVEKPQIPVGVRLQVQNVRKIQHFIEKILKKVILPLSAEPGLDDKPLIPAAEKAHDVPWTEGVVYALKDHLVFREVPCILNDLREDEDSLPLELLKGFVGDPGRKPSDSRKGNTFGKVF